jgi:hypothetical protein
VNDFGRKNKTFKTFQKFKKSRLLNAGGGEGQEEETE